MKRKSIIVLVTMVLGMSLFGCSSDSTTETESESIKATELISEIQTEVPKSMEKKSSTTYQSKKSVKRIEHYCEVSGCGKEGTKRITGISGQTEYYCQTHYDEMADILDEMVNSSNSSSSYSNNDAGYGYDSSDPYYSANDHNRDGKLNDQEFQDAMGDAIDDLLAEYGY